LRNSSKGVAIGWYVPPIWANTVEPDGSSIPEWGKTLFEFWKKSIESKQTNNDKDFK